MYELYFGKVLFPVTPGTINIKIGNDNKTITLVNKGEVSLPKLPKLTEISFDLFLPNQKYPWAVYPKGFKKASYYLNKLEALKVKKKKFQFIVTREMPNGKKLFDTNLKCVLEEYSIKEDAENGFDIYVSVTLKQYRPLETKTCSIETKDGKATVKTTSNRDGKSTNSTTKSHTVKKGETLTSLAKKYYGDSSKYKLIYNANKSVFKGRSANEVKVGDILTIPAE